MDDAIKGVLVGFFLGVLAIFVVLLCTGATPSVMERKLCGEADWKLPSCVARLERAVNEVKGDRK